MNAKDLSLDLQGFMRDSGRRNISARTKNDDKGKAGFRCLRRSESGTANPSPAEKSDNRREFIKRNVLRGAQM